MIRHGMEVKWLECDGDSCDRTCGAYSKSQSDRYIHRRAAKKYGWTHEGDKDFCLSCAKKEAQK